MCAEVSHGLVQRGTQTGRRKDVTEGTLGRHRHARTRRGEQSNPHPPRNLGESVSRVEAVSGCCLPLDEEMIRPSNRLRERTGHAPRPCGDTGV